MEARPDPAGQAPRARRDAAAAPPDRPFDGFRVPASAAARELVVEAARRVANYERHFGLRKRARKARDQAILEATVGSLVADLVHHHLERRVGAVAIPLDKATLGRRSRYKAPAINDTLPHVLRVMASPELGILDMTLGWHDLKARPDRDRFQQTTIRAGQWLRARIASMGLSFGDLGRDAAEELIILRGRKVPCKGGIRKAPLIDYVNDALTVRLREELRAIKAWLTQADIGVAVPLPGIDTGDRRLRRVFNNGRFDHGGRFSARWWVTMPKALRREHVRIEGERVATLDYASLYVRLAYARVGAVAPAGDLYACIPGLEAYRKGAKVLLNSLLFDQAPRSRKPMGSAEMLPKGVPVSELIAAIGRVHRPIAELFGAGIGFELMNVESNMVAAVLLRLRALGILGLPVHDAMLCRRSTAEAAASVMIAVAEEVAGCRLPVTVDAEDDGTEEVDLFEDDGPL